MADEHIYKLKVNDLITDEEYESIQATVADILATRSQAYSKDGFGYLNSLNKKWNENSWDSSKFSSITIEEKLVSADSKEIIKAISDVLYEIDPSAKITEDWLAKYGKSSIEEIRESIKSNNTVKAQSILKELADKYYNFTAIKGIHTSYSDCKNSCMGTCYNSCAGTCGSSCSNDCKDSCVGTCTSSCGVECSSSCFSSCKDTCYSGCSTSCKTDCAGNCGSTCKLYCKNDCGYNCGVSCSTTCAQSCYVNCSTVCSSQCSDDCTKTCKTACSNNCGTACKSDCTSQCKEEC